MESFRYIKKNTTEIDSLALEFCLSPLRWSRSPGFTGKSIAGDEQVYNSNTRHQHIEYWKGRK